MSKLRDMATTDNPLYLKIGKSSQQKAAYHVYNGSTYVGPRDFSGTLGLDRLCYRSVGSVLHMAWVMLEKFDFSHL